MKKISLLIIFVLVITGCSVKYNIVINEDLSVSEEAKLTGTTEFFNNYYKTTKANVLKDNLNVYKDLLEENNYKYELIEGETPYIIVTNTYNKVSDYIDKSILFNDYFDEIKYTENGDIKRIETIGYNANNPDDPNRFNVKELEISIKCPFKVKEHNANRVDEKNNIYYYELSEEKDLKIIFEYDSSKKFNPNGRMIETIIMCVAVVVVAWIAIIINRKNK
jgi:hypothetical protein